MKKQDFIDALRSELDTPFKLQGRLSKVGLDCAGLAVAALQKLGEEVEDARDYNMRPDAQLLISLIEKNGLVKIKKSDIDVGDLIIMKFDGNPQHLAFVTEKEDNNIRIIHANILKRKVVEHYLTDDLKYFIFAVYRFPRFED